MSTGLSDNLTVDEHSGVWELLPLYSNGTLGVEEGARVEAHVGSCPECQQELIRCRWVSTAARARTDDGWAPTPKHFAQVLDHIERREMRSEGVASGALPIASRLRAWFTAAPRSMRWAFGLQCVLLLALTGGILLRAAGPTPVYQTLSRAGPQFTGSHAHLRVFFAADINGKELRDLLQGIGAQIVQGPSPMGVYIIELPFAATAKPQLEASLATVRAHPKVRLAQPVDEGSSP
jgi:hypothetical protein